MAMESEFGQMCVAGIYEVVEEFTCCEKSRYNSKVMCAASYKEREGRKQRGRERQRERGPVK